MRASEIAKRCVGTTVAAVAARHLLRKMHGVAETAAVAAAHHLAVALDGVRHEACRRHDGFNRLLVGDQGVERIACVVECGQNVCFFPCWSSLSLCGAQGTVRLLCASRSVRGSGRKAGDVMRTGTGFRVTLEAEGRRVGELKALQRTVEERFVCRHGVGGKRFCIHGKTMVLARNVHVSRAQIHHGMVRAVMAELHLERLGADGESHDLVAEADAEKRNLPRDDLAGGLDGIRAGGGSPGPLERKTPSGFMASTSSTGVCAGTTVTRMPRSTSMRRMLVFTPKS